MKTIRELFDTKDADGLRAYCLWRFELVIDVDRLLKYKLPYQLDSANVVWLKSIIFSHWQYPGPPPEPEQFLYNELHVFALFHEETKEELALLALDPLFIRDRIARSKIFSTSRVTTPIDRVSFRVARQLREPKLPKVRDWFDRMLEVIRNNRHCCVVGPSC